MNVQETKPDYHWFQPNQAIITAAKQTARELDVDWLIASRLAMLSKTGQEISNYLNPTPQDIEHPEVTVPGILDAALALRDGIAKGEKVAIFADYDVDGQTSLAILSETLERAGGDIITGSANAETGFGLSKSFVEEAASAGAEWLVTVDCGSTQVDPIRLAQSSGMRVIVIDHHDVDRSNSADFHLNPRLAALKALETLSQAVAVGRCRQKLEASAPYDKELDRLTKRSKEILADELGDDRFDNLCQTIRSGSHPTNTGSMLTWKFAAAFSLAAASEVPDWLWGKPLYLAALGAVADLVPCDDQEVRAFVRVSCDRENQMQLFSNRRIVPLGVEMIARYFSEDPYRPDQLTRTRALLNLPKRTPLVDPGDIQELLRAGNRQQLRPIVKSLIERYESCSRVRLEEMDPEAIAQGGGEGLFSFAVLDGFEDYAGYARMCANTLVREYNRPAVVFVRKTASDEFGQTLYKFSGANGVVPEAKLGDLIYDEDMRRASTIRGRDWLGQEGDILHLGGHTEVVSGVCTADQIEEVKQACQQWAERLWQKKRWRVIDKKRPRVLQRRVSPQRLERLNQQAALLSPFAFPEQPSPQVSIIGRLVDIDKDDDRYQATLIDSDLGRSRVNLSDDIAEEVLRIGEEKELELIVNLGRPGQAYISKAALA